MIRVVKQLPNLGALGTQLIICEELVELVYQNYERFDARYPGLLPMRRIYVPEPMEEDAA